VKRIQVSLAGGGPVARGSFAVEVTLQAGDRVTTAVIDGDRHTAWLAMDATSDGPVLLTAR
jgi:hypothetical protein